MNLTKLNLSNEEIMDIASLTIEKANRRGFKGFSGYCGQAAIAINDVIFEGEQILFACFNQPLEEIGHHIGHVACLVELDNEEYFIIDSDGVPKSIEDISSWGMLDSQDPEYQQLFDINDIEKKEENFESVSELQLDKSFIQEIFDCSEIEEQKSILKKAYEEVLQISNISKIKNKLKK